MSYNILLKYTSIPEALIPIILSYANFRPFLTELTDSFNPCIDCGIILSVYIKNRCVIGIYDAEIQQCIRCYQLN